MEIGAQLNRQRVKHIVSSYQLDGNETDAFNLYLETLLEHYPSPLIELALVEILVARWLSVPLPKGCELLEQVHAQLQAWADQVKATEGAVLPITSTITPEQFQQITGLDPTPIFGTTSQPPVPPSMRSST